MKKNDIFDPAVISKKYYIIVRDMDEIEELNELQKEAYSSNSSKIRLLLGFNLNTVDEEKISVYSEISDRLSEYSENTDYIVGIESRTINKEGFIGTYGGIFFVGIFLGILFIMAAVLIIYYKQVSEGYDDRKRFEIMQKVGMSRA